MINLSRRCFLAGVTTSGLLARPGVLPAENISAFAAADPAAVPHDRWIEIREQFVLSPDWVHMASFFLVSHPKRVRDAIARFRDELDANPFHAVESGNDGPAPINRKLRVKRAA